MISPCYRLYGRENVLLLADCLTDQTLGCPFIELGIPVLLLCLGGDWVKVQLKMANDDCQFGLLHFEFC